MPSAQSYRKWRDEYLCWASYAALLMVLKPKHRFGKIASIAIDSHGSLCLTDPDNFLIRKIDRFGIVSTLAGRFNESGLIDGPKESAKFSKPIRYHG